MFTGIVEEVGVIRSVRKGIQSAALEIAGKLIFEDMHIGDSIAVNGVCLTVTSHTGETFTADVMAETLRRSSLGFKRAGNAVNLERAMPANGRFGGHFVSGHIDGTGEIVSFVREDNAVWLTIGAKPELLRYMVEKGSVAIDGVSLTIASVERNCFRVSLIPHTASNTTLLSGKTGDVVNLETDVIGKYVDRLLHFDQAPAGNGISQSFLAENGFL